MNPGDSPRASVRTVAARVTAAAAVYGVALSAGVGVGCAMPGVSCHLSPNANPVIGGAMAVLGLFAAGLVLMGGVVLPAARLLRRLGWLYWWSVCFTALATAVIPLMFVCIFAGGGCSPGNITPLSLSLMFASLCGGLFLWLSWLRHDAARRTIVERLAVQPHTVKTGVLFVGIYAAAVAAAALFVATSSGDMSGLVLLYITLPWPLVGAWLFGDGGMAAGVLLGFALNAGVAFSIGYGLARARRTAHER